MVAGGDLSRNTVERKVGEVGQIEFFARASENVMGECRGLAPERIKEGGQDFARPRILGVDPLLINDVAIDERLELGKELFGFGRKPNRRLRDLA